MRQSAVLAVGIAATLAGTVPAPVRFVLSRVMGRAYRREIALVDPVRLVFLDESGILTNLTRRYARAVIGERACGAAPVNACRNGVLSV